MFVTIRGLHNEEFGRNNVDRVEFTDSDQHQVDQFFDSAEVDNVMVIINLNNVVAVGLQPNLTEAAYQALTAFESELNLKLDAYEADRLS